MGYNLAIYNPKTRENVGSLIRTGQNFGLNSLFVIGGFVKEKYKGNIHKFEHQMNTQDGLSKINLQYFENLQEFLRHLPAQTNLVIVEMTPESKILTEFTHPNNATYLLGRETVGLGKAEIEEIKAFFKDLNQGIPEGFRGTFSKTARLDFVKIDTPESLNVAVCGAIVMYDRQTKEKNENV